MCTLDYFIYMCVSKMAIKRNWCLNENYKKINIKKKKTVSEAETGNSN